MQGARIPSLYIIVPLPLIKSVIVYDRLTRHDGVNGDEA